MQVRRLTIKNFRGVENGEVYFVGNTLLVGGNNAGKSTVCEALDLVLGPERLYRRPVVDEHDFYCGRYESEAAAPVEIRIEALLVDLSDEARRRLGERYLRRWDEGKRCFADEGEEGPGAADAEGTVWSLPIVFVGRYNPVEDDFEGNTFFAHPAPEEVEVEEGTIPPLGGGLSIFARDHKRLCGFVFLRALRTGRRALSLQRNSLLDTVLRLGGAGLNQMWKETLQRLRALNPAIGDIPQLARIRSEVRERMGGFVSLADGKNATGFFASDLTRGDLREVVQLFLATQEDGYLVPFEKHGTGTINMLVFALLTFIAELKGNRSVIFAMEEPEIALPPHTQRRAARFVLGEMGQAIITSHSPYVIEQFAPEEIVMLDRDKGSLKGTSVKLEGIREKTFRVQRRQFAEAILGCAVLVVEGSTEAAVFPSAAAVLESSHGRDYVHPDIAGLTVFDAGADSEVPKYGPVFKALKKRAFAFYDKPKKAFSEPEQEKLASYERVWESPTATIEELLRNEIADDRMRAFLEEVKERADYPSVEKYRAEMNDDEVRRLCREVLVARKGEAHGYAALLIGHCRNADELPPTIRGVLETINELLRPPVQGPDEGDAPGESNGGAEPA